MNGPPCFSLALCFSFSQFGSSGGHSEGRNASGYIHLSALGKICRDVFVTMMPVTSIKRESKRQAQLQLRVPADKKYSVNSGQSAA